MTYHSIRCRYCSGTFLPTKMTRDHIVPKWVLRHFPEFRHDRTNYVPACQNCNQKKGGAPVAEFMRARLVPGGCSQLAVKWNSITQKMDRLSYSDPEYAALRRMVLESFREQVTGFPGVPVSNAFRMAARARVVLSPFNASLANLLEAPSPARGDPFANPSEAPE